jgi:hypothetical protein
MTGRAAGAAVAPPAPCPTSSTHTAIWGWRSGAKAVNQASVSLVSFCGGGGLAGPGVAAGAGWTVFARHRHPRHCRADAGAADHHRAHEAGDGARHRGARGPRDDGGRAAVERRAGTPAALADGRRHERHLQRRGQHLALPDRRRADREIVPDLVGGRDRRAGRAREPGGRVEAERLGGFDQPPRPEPSAERCEDGVARLRKGLLERAAAGLPVRVLELHAGQRGRGLDGEARVTRDDVVAEEAGQRHDLERRAGRLRGRVGEAGQREDLAVARAHRGDAADAARERQYGGALNVGIDRGADIAAGQGAARRHHAAAGRQGPARAAGEAGVELALQARHADCRPRRQPARRQLRRLRGRRRPQRPGDLRRDRTEVGGARRPVRDEAAVTREERGAGRHPCLAREPLAGPQAREHERGAPIHAAAAGRARVGRHAEAAAQDAEDARGERHRQLGDVPVGARAAGLHPHQRERLGGLAVATREPPRRRVHARVVRQQRVHRPVVAALPGSAERARHPARRRHVPGADDDARDQRQRRHDGERHEPPRRHDSRPPGRRRGSARGLGGVHR